MGKHKSKEEKLALVDRICILRKEGKTTVAIGKDLGIPRRTVENLIRDFRQDVEIPPPPKPFSKNSPSSLPTEMQSDVEQTVEKKETDDELEYISKGEHIKTVADLVRYAGIDLERYDIYHQEATMYEVTARDSNKQLITKQNHRVHVRARLKKLPGGFTWTEIIQQLRDGILDLRSKVTKLATVIPTDMAFLATSGEPHFGKIAWDLETGEKYNLEIARERFIRTHEKNAARLRAFGRFEEGALRIGDDFVNAEANNHTTAGTPQEMDGRWQQIFRVSTEAAIRMVEIYRGNAPRLKVFINPGNHDSFVCFFLGEVLSTYYRTDPNIEVINSPATRRYWRWGRVLIQMTHGNEEKDQDLSALMRLEAKNNWFETDVHESHTAHKHKTEQKGKLTMSRDEALGFTLERLRSLSGTDAWHAKKGYRGTLKAIDSFVYSKTEGRIGHFTVAALD